MKRILLALIAASTLCAGSVVQAAAAQDVDTGCLDATSALLDLVLPPPTGNVATFLQTPAGQMLDAALKGDVRTVEAQLKSGVPILSEDERPQYRGNNALHHAARRNDVELAQLLLSRGMDVDAPGPTGYTPLHVASGLGRLAMVRFLLDHGANMDALDRLAGTPLEIAIVQGRSRAVDLLIAGGALKNAPAGHDQPLHALRSAASLCPAHARILMSLKRAGVPMDSTVVRLAQRSGDIARTMGSPAFGFDWSSPRLYGAWADAEPRPAIVQLACGEDGAYAAIAMFRDAPDRDALKKVAVGPWGTPMHCAQGDYDKAIVDRLLAVGFDPNARDRNGRSALHRSFQEADAVLSLARAGADVNARDNEGKTPLFYQVYPDPVLALLQHKADPNLPNRAGRTPLFEVDSDLVTGLLIAGGARLDVRDPNGQTPLLYRIDHQKGVVPLLQAGADVHVRDEFGATAMHYALGRLARDTYPMLGPSNVSAVDRKGRTPLHYVAVLPDRFLDADVLAFAQKNGASLDARDAEGNTPLHYAVATRKIAIATALIKAGADTSARNMKGARPLDLLADDAQLEPLRKLLTAK